MKLCKHPNCSNKQYQIKEAEESTLSLCKYHQKEFAGESDWICTWCSSHREQMEDYLREVKAENDLENIYEMEVENNGR